MRACARASYLAATRLDFLTCWASGTTEASEAAGASLGCFGCLGSLGALTSVCWLDSNTDAVTLLLVLTVIASEATFAAAITAVAETEVVGSPPVVSLSCNLM